MARRKWLALAGVALAVLAVGLDGTILAVALPTLSGALHASATDLVWFSSAYLLAQATAMLPMGVLGDRYGRKRVMLLSLAGFGIASTWAALSGSAGWFIVARTIGGIAGAGIVVMALSAVSVLFEEAERSRAVGIWAAVNFLALPAGPLLGGWLLSRFWWGWVFLINVPVVIAAIVVVLLLVPESRGERRGPLDWFGVVLFSGGLVATVWGFAEAGDLGWGSPWVLASWSVGIGLLAGFGLWQRRLARSASRSPLIDPRLFRIPGVAWGAVLAFVTSVPMMGIFFTLPQYFQAVVGTDAIGSGLRLLPLIGGLVVGAAFAEPVAARIGQKTVLTVGFAILGSGLALGSLTNTGSGLPFLAAWTAIVGVGIGVGLSTAVSAAIVRVPAESSGVASAVVQSLQDAGGPFGAAVLGAVALASYRSALDVHGLSAADATSARSGVFTGLAIATAHHVPELTESVRTAFLAGMNAALLTGAAVAIVGALCALLFFPRRDRTAMRKAVTVETYELPDGQKLADT